MSDEITEHTGGLVRVALRMQLEDSVRVPCFIGAAVGTGKTTGAVSGIAELFKESGTRSVMLTPYIDHADKLYHQLVELVGRENVCVFTSKHNRKTGDSDETRSHPVVSAKLKHETYENQFYRDEVHEYPIAVVCHQIVTDKGSANCSIPDDHIAPRRSALFMARWVLTEVRDGRATC